MFSDLCWAIIALVLLIVAGFMDVSTIISFATFATVAALHRGQTISCWPHQAQILVSSDLAAYFWHSNRVLRLVVAAGFAGNIIRDGSMALQ